MKSKVSLKARSTGPDLTLTVCLDGYTIYQDQPGDDPVEISHEFWDNDNTTTHTLTLQLSGKEANHTRLDANGEIIEDRVIHITDVAFDNILLGHLFVEKAQYHHDFNGYGEPIVDKFFGAMGCNGTVELEFSSPIYLWLLENM